MFEIQLDDEGKKKEETREEEKKLDDTKEEEEEEMDLLNQTLSFQEGEELRHRDWSGTGAEAGHDEATPKSKVRRGWSQGAPQTLLDALAGMDVSSVCTTMAGPGQGDAAVEEGEALAVERKQWGDIPPNTLLNALAQADLISTLDSQHTEALTEGEDEAEGERTEDDEDEDSDVEVDEERLEPRSDDDDTNFEESEDELRGEVAESMMNLFIMEDGESGREEEGGERDVTDGVVEKEEEGCSEEPVDPQQITAVIDSTCETPRDTSTEGSPSQTLTQAAGCETQPEQPGEAQASDQAQAQTEDCEITNKQRAD